MSGIKYYVLNENCLKIILSGFYALKTLPYTLLLYGKQGTADFGELRQKKYTILPCCLVA